jgi:L-fuconolactonase
MRIDAHQHFWTLARGDYGWLTEKLTPIYRDFGPPDLQPHLKRHNIARTILVQAAPTIAETHFMLDLAQKTPFVAGVVGWADFEAPHAADTIAKVARNVLLVGLRPMVHDIADDDWLLRDDLVPAFEALIDHGLVFDALVRPRHLPRLLKLIERHPGLSVVVDHAAKPDIREQLFDPWHADLADVATHSSVVCKLSGLVTEAPNDWTRDDLRPYVEHLLYIFGPERLLFGSDWPVVNLAADYDRWFEAALSLLADLTDSEREAVLGGNAERIYLRNRGRR